MKDWQIHFYLFSSIAAERPAAHCRPSHRITARILAVKLRCGQCTQTLAEYQIAHLKVLRAGRGCFAGIDQQNVVLHWTSDDLRALTTLLFENQHAAKRETNQQQCSGAQRPHTTAKL